MKKSKSSHKAPSYRRRLERRAVERVESQKAQDELARVYAAEDAAAGVAS